MSQLAPVIEVEGVSKRFRLYHEKYTSLKERVIHLGHTPYEEFWALRDISMVVGEGETVGLLGHNGSGKSTLLNCIAAILQPTSGRIVVRGQLAAMLELGSGFHPELSGRDNIYLNASLLGMARREIDKRFEAIVAFAELEPFIDNQVKYYSSGMYTRLGFAVAVNMEPDILLVDEVLAVGDENFQRKCIERVRRFQDEGRTIVFVSHAPDLVRQICKRAYVLHHGHLVAEGPPGEAIRAYREHLRALGEEVPDELTADAVPPEPGGPVLAAQADGGAGVVSVPTNELALPKPLVRITGVGLEHPGAGSRPYLLPNEPLVVRVGYETTEPVDDVVFGIAIHDVRGELVFGANTEVLEAPVGVIEGSGEVAFSFEGIPLLDGTYDLIIGVHRHAEGPVYDWREAQDHFEVMNPARTVGLVALPLRIEVHQASGGERVAG